MPEDNNKSTMKKILCYLFYSPVSIGLFLAFSYLSYWILTLFWKVLFFIIGFGSRFYSEPYGIEIPIENFKSFLLVDCLGVIISGGLSGLIAGLIAPKNEHSGVTTIIPSALFLTLVILIISISWVSEHWFYSTVWVLALILSWAAFTLFLYATHNEKEE